MRIIILFFIVAAFMLLPVYMFDTLVMPELMNMQNTYAHADDIAQHVVAAN